MLVLEDAPLDAELIVNELRLAGFEPEWERVSSEPEFIKRTPFDYDLILADYQLPHFDGLQALQLVRACADTPFILISGTIEDHAAVEAIRGGADDYLLKDRLARLGPAIERALEQRRIRAAEARAQQALRAAEEKYRMLLDTSMDAVIMVDEEGLIQYANRAVQAMFGYAPLEVTGLEIAMLHPEHLRGAQGKSFGHDPKSNAGASSRPPEESIGLHRDGHELPLEIAFSDMSLAGRRMNAYFLRDITERKYQQDRIIRLTRIYAVLSGINAALLHVRDEQQLLEAACRIAVDHGQFGIVWIGRFDASTQDVTPVASAGLEDSEFLKSAKLHLGPGTSQSRGIVARTIRERVPIYVNDITSDAGAGGQRRREAIRRGYRSVIALPLMIGNEVAAVFALFAKETQFFDDSEVKLLMELAENISFALESIAREHKLEKLSRIRSVSGEINAAIVRTREREALLRETCRIVAEHGKFEFVWTALIDTESEQIQPVAWNGFSDETALGLDWSSLGNPRVTLHEVLLTGRPAVRNDIAGEAPTGTLRQAALAKGCGSAICLPFIVDDKVVAALNLFAVGRDFFDQDELTLLEELTADISFALQSIARQEKLDYLSYYDSLTGLPNRQLFMDRVGQQMRSRGGEPRMVAVILCEIQRFRSINETITRHGGDDLLKQVATRLETAFNGKDYLARVGADCFAVAVRGVRDPAEAANMIENQIFGCFSQPFIINADELRVAARASIALFPADGVSADVLFANAEAALKRAKSGADRYLFYAPEMNAQAAQSILLEQKLRTAVDARQFVLHYQPKIDLATRAVCGLEALIRWQDPTSGLVPPGAFIPILEETGLIIEVGQWVIAQALADYRDWKSRGYASPRIAVNVSAVQLQQKDFADKVVDAVKGGGNLPEALELEITESLLMKDLEGSIRKLSILREMGIHIAMDDFGTGYSSLSYIARLPIDIVKIDRAFVAGMVSHTHDMAIVTTILALARSLNLRVVAEGIETEQQLQLLSGLQCHEGQGYLFSKPLPAAEIDRLLSHST